MRLQCKAVMALGCCRLRRPIRVSASAISALFVSDLSDLVCGTSNSIYAALAAFFVQVVLLNRSSTAAVCVNQRPVQCRHTTVHVPTSSEHDQGSSQRGGGGGGQGVQHPLLCLCPPPPCEKVPPPTHFPIFVLFHAILRKCSR